MVNEVDILKSFKGRYRVIYFALTGFTIFLCWLTIILVHGFPILVIHIECNDTNLLNVIKEDLTIIPSLTLKQRYSTAIILLFPQISSKAIPDNVNLSYNVTPIFNYSHPLIKKLELEKTKPKDIVNYVINNVRYYPHLTQFYPWKTLREGYGDCDDIAILIVTLLRKYGYKSTVIAGYVLNPQRH